MMTIHKFELAPVVKMPAGATIVKVGVDLALGKLVFWALVNTDAKPEKRFFAMAKTGEKLPEEMADCPHLDTLSTVNQMPDGTHRQLITHVWEVPAYLAKKLPGA